MRIAINGMFWSQPTVGSGQYLHNLVAALTQHSSRHQFVLVVPRYLAPVRPHVPGCQVVTMPTPFDRRSDNLAKLWFEQVDLGQVCRKLRIDLLHVPYFAAPWRTSQPVVVTIHDIIPLLLPEYRGSRNVQLYMRLAAAGARRAPAVIADSEHTRRDIITHLGIPPERISVTHLAPAPEYGPRNAHTIAEARDRFRLRRPYVYYIGGFDARKNVEMVIRAFAEATRTWADRPILALAGRIPQEAGALFPDISRLILDVGIAADVALLGPVSNDDNAALMAGCAAFMFPSRYEGFGLTPLEAMRSGAPVIASSTTSVGEVVGTGGLLVAPNDLQAWVAALQRVLTDQQFAAELRQRGLERASSFAWRKTMVETIAVYETVGRERRQAAKEQLS